MCARCRRHFEILISCCCCPNTARPSIWQQQQHNQCYVVLEEISCPRGSRGPIYKSLDLKSLFLTPCPCPCPPWIGYNTALQCQYLGYNLVITWSVASRHIVLFGKCGTSITCLARHVMLVPHFSTRLCDVTRLWPVTTSRCRWNHMSQPITAIVIIIIIIIIIVRLFCIAPIHYERRCIP